MSCKLSTLKLWLLVWLFACLVPILPFAILQEIPGAMWFENGNSTYVFVVGATFLAIDIFLPVPSSIVAVILGAQLGFIWGTLAVSLGLTIGCAVGYCTAWHVGYPILKYFTSVENRLALSLFQDRFGLLSLALFRAVPVLGEASVLVAGAMRLDPVRAFGTLLISNITLGLVYAGLGSIGSTISPMMSLLGGIGVPAFAVFIRNAVLPRSGKRRA